MKCPLCKSPRSKSTIIKSAKISGSLLYGDITINKCKSCGHVYNDITGWDAPIYYKNEYEEAKYTPTVGGNDFLGHEYDNNYAIVTQNNHKSWIDMLVNINSDRFNSDWPTRNFVALDQFLEHCWNINSVMRYLRHTIPSGRAAYISVPDLSRYDSKYLFLIKEHIHHFDLPHLTALFKKWGFALQKSRESILDVLGGAMKMPIIECLFSNTKPDGVYCYGAGREMLYAIENNMLNGAIIDAIIDDTPYKQGRHIDGIPIISSDNIDENKTIIITPYYSANKIMDKLSHHKGEIICLNKTMIL